MPYQKRVDKRMDGEAEKAAQKVADMVEDGGVGDALTPRSVHQTLVAHVADQVDQLVGQLNEDLDYVKRRIYEVVSSS